MPFSECVLILALGSIINNEAHACDEKRRNLSEKLGLF